MASAFDLSMQLEDIPPTQPDGEEADDEDEDENEDENEEKEALGKGTFSENKYAINVLQLSIQEW